MANQPTPHDALFKAVFSRLEHAAAALAALLPPAIVARLDLSTLALRPGSFIDEALTGRHSDLLFSAQLSGRPVLIYVLSEHQSTVEPLMAFRLLRYMVRIWEAHLADHPRTERLPAILPLVVHHSEHGWQAAVSFEALLDLDPETLAVVRNYVPRFQFVLEDISHETDEALKARAMTALGRLALWCFRHARRPEELVTRIEVVLDLVHEVRKAPGGVAALALIWRYVFVVSERRPAELVRQLIEAAGREAEEEIVTAAEWLEEQGRIKGLQQGLREGQRNLLLRQLRTRFGAVPQELVARVETAGLEQLEQWADRVLTAQSLAEVFEAG